VPVGTLPESERVIRPLTRIKDSDKQRDVYRKAVETAPEGKVTTKHLENIVKEITNKTKTPVIEHPEMEIDYSRISDARTFAHMAIGQLKRIPEKDPLRREAIQKVLDWCIVQISHI
jgi:hypothetical protein